MGLVEFAFLVLVSAVPADAPPEVHAACLRVGRTLSPGITLVTPSEEAAAAAARAYAEQGAWLRALIGIVPPPEAVPVLPRRVRET